MGISKCGVSLEAAEFKFGSAQERCSFEACLLPEGRAAQVQLLSEQGMGEVHVSLKLAVSDLDPGGHDQCCLLLAGGPLLVHKGQIELGDVNVACYGDVIVDDRIAILDSGENLAGLNYGKMRLFFYLHITRNGIY